MVFAVLLSVTRTCLQRKVFVLISSGASTNAPSAALNHRSGNVSIGGC